MEHGRPRPAAAAVGWLFRSRRTGRISVVAPPNASLSVWLVTVALRVLPLPDGAASFVRGVGIVALVVWALDELLRGVNPFRRGLGAVVLAAQLASWWSGR